MVACGEGVADLEVWATKPRARSALLALGRHDRLDLAAIFPARPWMDTRGSTPAAPGLRFHPRTGGLQPCGKRRRRLALACLPHGEGSGAGRVRPGDTVLILGSGAGVALCASVRAKAAGRQSDRHIFV